MKAIMGRMDWGRVDWPKVLYTSFTVAAVVLTVLLLGCTYQAYPTEFGTVRQWSTSLGNKGQSASSTGATVGTDATFIKDGVVQGLNSAAVQGLVQGALASQGLKLDAENTALKAENDRLKEEIARLRVEIEAMMARPQPVNPAGLVPLINKAGLWP